MSRRFFFLPIFRAGEFFSPALRAGLFFLKPPELFLLNRGGGGGGGHPYQKLFSEFFFFPEILPFHDANSHFLSITYFKK